MPKKQLTKTHKKPVKRTKVGGRVVPRLRDWEVMKLREEGLSYEAIADTMTRRKMPMSPTTAHQIVTTVLKNMNVNMAETREAVKTMELRRLDSMLEISTKLAKSRGKAFVRLAAVDRVLKISERRAKLEGLDINRSEHNHNHLVRVYEGIEEYQNDTGVTIDATPLLESGEN